MEKVKNMFENLKSVFKNLFKDFGITTTIIFLSSIIYTFLLLFRRVLKSSEVKQSPQTSVEWQIHGCIFAISIPELFSFDRLNEKYSLAPVAMPRMTLAYVANGTRFLNCDTSVGE